MKKLLSIVLILAMLLSLVACDGTKEESSSTPATTPKAPAHEHAFGEWQTVTASTCTEKGLEERICECGETEQQKIDTIEHTFTATVTEPTCLESGYTTYTCECGKSYKSDKTNAKGHAFGEWYVVTAPTCTEKGVERSDCRNCEHYVTGEIAATDHELGDWYVSVPPTCLSEGEERRDCKHEGCTLFETRKVASLGGHSFGEWQVTVAPTCTEKGEEKRGCTNCDEAETRSIASLGGHKLGEWQITVGATCTTDGEKKRTCTNTGCGHFETETIASGHDMGDWSVVTAATCTSDGEEKRECKNCDHSETRVISSSNGHDLSYWYTTSSPSLTTVGSERRTCKTCNYYETSVIPMLTEASGVEAYSITNDRYVKNSTTIPYRRQGGCINGKNLYHAYLTKNQEYACVVKKNIATGETIFSENIKMGHANDMTYNSKTNCVYVVSGSTLYIFDADTLEYKGTMTLGGSASGISYNAHNDTYVGFSGGTISFYDAQGKRTGGFAMSKKGTTSQGICTDEDYIYSLYCTGIGNEKYYCYVYIYDYSGNHINTVTVKIPENFEPENISVINGTLYIGACSTQPVVTFYKVVGD